MIPVSDISYAQGHVDFAHLRAVGVVGVIVRVGDEIHGTQPSDNWFVGNVEGALAQGMAVGTYIFCRPNKGRAADFGRRYAWAVKSAFPGVDFQLGHYPDHENFWGKGACPISAPAYSAWVTDHAAAFDDTLQVEAGIYTGQSHWNSYIRSTSQGFRRLWVARYPFGRLPPPTDPTPDVDELPDDWEDWAMRRPPGVPMGWSQWDGWQFSSGGPGSAYGVQSAGLDMCLFRRQLDIPAPAQPDDDEEDDVRRTVMVPNGHPASNGRWPFWMFTGEHIVSANGAPPLQDSVLVLGVPTVAVPQPHRPIIGIEPAPDGNGVIATADDQSTYTFRTKAA